MDKRGRIKKNLLVACVSMSLLQPITFGVFGSLLIAAGSGAARAQTLNTEAIARIAQAITVRIEGATQGSGVLVNREGNRYTVLTAWHVVGGQRPGEELAIITPDGKQHRLEQGSITRLGSVDLAVLSFSSAVNYAVAQLGEMGSVAMGNPIYVAGFPLASSAVPTRLLRFLDGKVIANATVAIPNGYQLLYSGQQPTLPGMSGGPVFNSAGQLVGIHGQSETEDRRTEQEGVFVKTGTNQAVPIGFYRQFVLGAPSPVATGAASTADDYLVQAKQLLRQTGREQEVIQLADLVLRQMQSADAYLYRGAAKLHLDDNQAAIADFNQALAINSQYLLAYASRGIAKSALGDEQGAIADYNQVLAIKPRHADDYLLRGSARFLLGDGQGAIADYSHALAIDPRNIDAYIARGSARSALGDNQNAIADYNQALAINPRYADAYSSRGNSKRALGDTQGAIADYNQALAINPRYAIAYSNRGIAKYDLGDKEGACADFKQATSLGNKIIIELIQAELAAWCREMQ
jgi:tetratricopeptide (TPR) repeat protein/S1-C subfamily serine protease